MLDVGAMLDLSVFDFDVPLSPLINSNKSKVISNSQESSIRREFYVTDLLLFVIDQPGEPGLKFLINDFKSPVFTTYDYPILLTDTYTSRTDTICELLACSWCFLLITRNGILIKEEFKPIDLLFLLYAPDPYSGIIGACDVVGVSVEG